MNSSEITKHIKSIVSAANRGDPQILADRIESYILAEQRHEEEGAIRRASETLAGAVTAILDEDDDEDDDEDY